jgi:hypothetical protein
MGLIMTICRDVDIPAELYVTSSPVPMLRVSLARIEAFVQRQFYSASAAFFSNAVMTSRA